MIIKGAITAIVTPFKDGKFDDKAYENLIEWQISEGIHALLPCGTTGEASTLDYDEHYKVIEVAVKAANKRVPIIAGTGSNSTDETIEITKKAKELGADAVLIVTPYYNKPTQEGLYRHYKLVAETVDIPIVLYNVPGRTSVNMLPSTVARLAEIKNIVAIKEATGDMKQVSEIIRLCGDKISVISGDDFTTLTLLALGGNGVISVSANVAPKMVSEMCNAWFAGDIEKARKLHYTLEPLNAAMFIETNPIPAKTALSMMGKIKEDVRMPLCEMSQGNKEKLQSVLKTMGLV